MIFQETFFDCQMSSSIRTDWNCIVESSALIRASCINFSATSFNSFTSDKTEFRCFDNLLCVRSLSESHLTCETITFKGFFNSWLMLDKNIFDLKSLLNAIQQFIERDHQPDNSSCWLLVLSRWLMSVGNTSTWFMIALTGDKACGKTNRLLRPGRGIKWKPTSGSGSGCWYGPGQKRIPRWRYFSPARFDIKFRAHWITMRNLHSHTAHPGM